MRVPLLERLTQLSGPRTGPSRPLVPCPLCGATNLRVLGVRGNREHAGADPRATPHLFTNVTRCARCDFVFANPPIPEAEALEAEHYASAERYEATSGGADGTSRMFRDRLVLLARYHGAKGTLLDVGAGKGEFVREAARAGFDADGVEPSAGLAAHAALGARVHHGTLGDVPALAGQRFDVVTLNHVLEHVASPRALLDQIRAHLAPGGLLFIEVPNADAHLARLIDVAFRARGRAWSSRLSPVHPPFHSQGYTPRSLRWLLEDDGWDVLDLVTRSGHERGVGGAHSRTTRRLAGAAFRALSLFGNRELLLALARRRT